MDWINDGIAKFCKKQELGSRRHTPDPPHIACKLLGIRGREDGSTLQSFSSNAAKLIGSVRQDYAITLSHGQLPELTQDICAAHDARGT